MHIRYLAVIILFITTKFSLSQNFAYSNFKVETLSFSNGNLKICYDEDAAKSYAAPHIDAPNNIKNPVAYVSGTAPGVAATFTFDCANAPASAHVRGKGEDNIDFPSKKVDFTAGSGTTKKISYPESVASSTFKKDVVRYFSDYKIKWQISFDNEATWHDMIESTNTLYVVKSAPQAETNSFKWSHTVYDLSCRNANEKSEEKDIIAGIWNEFTDQVILNAKKDSLFYYKKLNIANAILPQLLANKDGQCYCFAQLFLAAIKIQGIVRTNNYVLIRPKGNTYCGSAVDRFLVKDWKFNTPSASSKCAEFPYKIYYSVMIPAPYTEYKFTTSDITDVPGVAGSCTKNPASYFGSHQICLVDGIYYDPSYGLKYASLKEMKEQALSGWGIRATSEPATTCYFTNDVSKSEFAESITTY